MPISPTHVHKFPDQPSSSGLSEHPSESNDATAILPIDNDFNFDQLRLVDNDLLHHSSPSQPLQLYPRGSFDFLPKDGEDEPLTPNSLQLYLISAPSKLSNPNHPRVQARVCSHCQGLMLMMGLYHRMHPRLHLCLNLHLHHPVHHLEFLFQSRRQTHPRQPRILSLNQT
jgi:hypothetical protein